MSFAHDNCFVCAVGTAVCGCLTRTFGSSGRCLERRRGAQSFQRSFAALQSDGARGLPEASSFAYDDVTDRNEMG